MLQDGSFFFGFSLGFQHLSSFTIAIIFSLNCLSSFARSFKHIILYRILSAFGTFNPFSFVSRKFFPSFYSGFIRHTLNGAMWSVSHRHLHLGKMPCFSLHQHRIIFHPYTFSHPFHLFC
jgi:hypothetical protein